MLLTIYFISTYEVTEYFFVSLLCGPFRLQKGMFECTKKAKNFNKLFKIEESFKLFKIEIRGKFANFNNSHISTSTFPRS